MFTGSPSRLATITATKAAGMGVRVLDTADELASKGEGRSFWILLKVSVKVRSG